MLSFFIGLKRSLEASQRKIFANMVLGAVARDAIRSIFIPKLEKKLERATGSERERLESLIELYEEYGDERSSKGRMYDGIAVKTVMDITQTRGLTRDYAEELAQDMVGDFYSNGLKVFEKFDEDGGPLAFMKFWKTVISNIIKYRAREFTRQQQTILNKQLSRADSEGHEQSPIDKLQSPLGVSDIDREWMGNIYKDLIQAVKKYSKKRPVLSDIFETWLEAVKSNGGPDKVNVSKDIAIPLLDKGYPKQTVYENWKKIQKEMVRFLEDEDIYLTDRAKRKLKMAESVAYEMFRRRLSRWILQDIDSELF